MWIAQHPCGTWCAYKQEPRKKLTGWDGEIYSTLNIQSWLISWRDTLRWMSEKDYQDRYRVKEVK